MTNWQLWARADGTRCATVAPCPWLFGTAWDSPKYGDASFYGKHWRAWCSDTPQKWNASSVVIPVCMQEGTWDLSYKCEINARASLRRSRWEGSIGQWVEPVICAQLDHVSFRRAREKKPPRFSSEYPPIDWLNLGGIQKIIDHHSQWLQKSIDYQLFTR